MYFVASHQEGERGAKVVGIPPDWDEFMAAESGYRNAEEECLLYVAVTVNWGTLLTSCTYHLMVRISNMNGDV